MRAAPVSDPEKKKAPDGALKRIGLLFQWLGKNVRRGNFSSNVANDYPHVGLTEPYRTVPFFKLVFHEAETR